ncbi:MAG: hypothetical protein EOP87_02745 [Verrucomicrobiaceae bacterium]|nr:MAG: hypothetical protein EOP87_02745 [Verrucomicrobiaceae bacterium]
MSVRPMMAALVVVATVTAGLAGEVMKVESKQGSVTSNTVSGETSWVGELKFTHPRFILAGSGRATLYSGVALKLPLAGPGGAPAPLASLSAHAEWISIVALGNWEITTIENGSRSKPVRSDRFVYLPKEDRIVIGWPDRSGPKP